VVSRRTIITLPLAVAMGGLAAGTALATSFHPQGGLGPVPRTLARRRPVLGGRLRTVPEERMTHLAVSWSGADATIATRNGAGWTTWAHPDACQGGPDGTATGGHMLLVARDVTEYEVILNGEAAQGLVTEINTVDGPVLAVAAEPLGAMPLPDGTSCPVTYLSRAAWGADEGLRFSGGTEVWPSEYASTQALTVHHTAGANNDPDPAGTIRAIYYYQCVTQAWGDIGYHLFIDEQGRVYEGRWSGPDAVPVFDRAVPAGTDPGLVTAGHVGGYNTGNLGVCLLGNLTNQGPTPAARATLVTVLASLARVTGVDPQTVVNYLGPTGATRTVLGVSGHRDWAATECPGNSFYPNLPDIRAEVAAQLAATPTPTATAEPTASPSASAAPTPPASASPTPSTTASPSPTRTKRRGPKP
jgi:N-acetylmuramoyl-L-alanine amidase